MFEEYKGELYFSYPILGGGLHGIGSIVVDTEELYDLLLPFENRPYTANTSLEIKSTIELYLRNKEEESK